MATIYVSGTGITRGMKTLLENDGIVCVTVDVSGNPERRTSVLEHPRGGGLPVIELDGRFATCQSIVVVARTLGLPLRKDGPGPPSTSCC